VEESQLGNCAQKGKGKGGPNWHADWTMMQVKEQFGPLKLMRSHTKACC
jgi:hypothetical protein